MPHDRRRRACADSHLHPAPPFPEGGPPPGTSHILSSRPPARTRRGRPAPAGFEAGRGGAAGRAPRSAGGDPRSRRWPDRPDSKPVVSGLVRPRSHASGPRSRTSTTSPSPSPGRRGRRARSPRPEGGATGAGTPCSDVARTSLARGRAGRLAPARAPSPAWGVRRSRVRRAVPIPHRMVRRTAAPPPGGGGRDGPAGPVGRPGRRTLLPGRAQGPGSWTVSAGRGRPAWPPAARPPRRLAPRRPGSPPLRSGGWRRGRGQRPRAWRAGSRCSSPPPARRRRSPVRGRPRSRPRCRAPTPEPPPGRGGRSSPGSGRRGGGGGSRARPVFVAVTTTTPRRANEVPSYRGLHLEPPTKAPPWIHTITSRSPPSRPGVKTLRLRQSASLISVRTEPPESAVPKSEEIDDGGWAPASLADGGAAKRIPRNRSTPSLATPRPCRTGSRPRSCPTSAIRAVVPSRGRVSSPVTSAAGRSPRLHRPVTRRPRLAARAPGGWRRGRGPACASPLGSVSAGSGRPWPGRRARGTGSRW